MISEKLTLSDMYLLQSDAEYYDLDTLSDIVQTVIKYTLL
jgi:hypothetical protein